MIIVIGSGKSGVTFGRKERIREANESSGSR